MRIVLASSKAIVASAKHHALQRAVLFPALFDTETQALIEDDALPDVVDGKVWDDAAPVSPQRSVEHLLMLATFPANSQAQPRRHTTAAFAWSVINRHFDVAGFLLQHGADTNTTWNSHEPASILRHLVFYGSYESMRFLIDRGIDMTIRDYRWNSTAQGWARYGKKDQRMAQWLEDAERQRELRR